MSQSAVDTARLELFPERNSQWHSVKPGRGKGDDMHIAPWQRFIVGENADYPQQILAAQWAEVTRRMDRLRSDDGDPEHWDVHHWQDINPVHTEALVQLTCGGPQIIYHGGLLHVRLRYHDAQARRPGLPPDVAALVHDLGPEHVTVTLHNISPLNERRLLIQGGAFGEHLLDAAQDSSSGDVWQTHDGYLRVMLPPGRAVTLRITMRRYALRPSYAAPAWF
ncbi:hypothetical protein HC891_07765 [Candidatus Gracilibacteria bacterium]|nr:hypothetical protein [Candidatus Gracilibacteria bacterium]